MFDSEILSLLLSVFQHKFINSLFLFDFKLIELFSEIQCFINSFFKRNKFLLKLQLLYSIFRFDF